MAVERSALAAFERAGGLWSGCLLRLLRGLVVVERLVLLVFLERLDVLAVLEKLDF